MLEVLNLNALDSRNLRSRASQIRFECYECENKVYYSTIY